jgi:hypothetical protein
MALDLSGPALAAVTLGYDKVNPWDQGDRGRQGSTA